MGKVADCYCWCSVYSLDLWCLYWPNEISCVIRKRAKQLLGEWKTPECDFVYLWWNSYHDWRCAASGGRDGRVICLRPVCSGWFTLALLDDFPRVSWGVWKGPICLSTVRFQKMMWTSKCDDTYRFWKQLGAFEDIIKWNTKTLLYGGRELAQALCGPYRHMPDKAIDVVDEAERYQRLQARR